ncbi:MAG TPA: hypothetical protein VFR37_14980 [Longimicrobium sp.]|nr:hypothetical protein [Longimicrobium sp.]
MDLLFVETGRMQHGAAAVAGLIMVPLGLASLAMGLSGGGIVPIAIGAMMLGTFGAVVWLTRRATARSVRYFSSEGLERNDRTWLPWAELERVVYQVREVAGQKKLWRTEIWFRNGETAWLLPLRVRNGREVNEFLASLPCDHVEEKV